MLISMPTGTSTILGVFQAILALLANRTNSALGVNYCAWKSSPAKSCLGTPMFYAATQKEFNYLCGMSPKQSRINKFRICRMNRDKNVGSTRRGEFPIKKA
jgi:hypothetical protein